MTEQILTIRSKLLTLNEYINMERANKFGAAKMKKTETERVAWECKVQKIKPIGKMRAVVFIYYHDSTRIDFNNYEFFQKFCFDGLKMAGIIKDDSQKYTPTRRLHVHRYDKKDPRLEIHFA